MIPPVSSCKKRWLIPEVVQTSAMDCGPAALKSLFEGFGISASYGRLRELCQTSVDGTSIDDLEVVANQLGLQAEQVMLPLDHLFISATSPLPALIVCRHGDGSTHFVVIWRQHGRWLQVMDPAIGRRWVSRRRFAKEIFRHEQLVRASDWREWAASADARVLFEQRLIHIGASQADGRQLFESANDDPHWFGLASLDAALRLIGSMIDAGGLKPGGEAESLLRSLLMQVGQEDIYRTIPLAYWSVIPQRVLSDEEEMLALNGAVFLHIKGCWRGVDREDAPPLSDELSAVLEDPPDHPLRLVANLLRTEGLMSPWPLVAAAWVSAAAVLLETLLFRGIFDIGWDLRSVEQRVFAIAGLLFFVSSLLLIELPVMSESLRFGRHIEARLRMALMRKLARLKDSYYRSRPISDIAERGHSIAVTRNLPILAVEFAQTVFGLVFTLIGILLIDLHSAPLALIIAGLAISLPLMTQPLINERDLRMRSHSGALFRFYLDALMGLVPIRAHSAEGAVRREHEGLLVEWGRAGRGLIQLQLVGDGVQSLLCTLAATALLFDHFNRTGAINGGDLLLVYWALKLPALGQHLTELAQRYPAQRNSLLRLMEPLSSPEESSSAPAAVDVRATIAPVPAAVGVHLRHADVKAGGHTLLHDINLTVAPGEHIAIIGPSGAGKSSLLGLLLGWHDLAKGSIAVDGQPLVGAALQQLRSTTAWVDPSIQIWNRSFLDNLTFSTPNYDLNALSSVIDSAALLGILQKLPKGLQTLLGEGGGVLSGGEGQRLRLARALLQENVRLALLDEPFRGLDREQRRSMLTLARKWWQSATLLCITHDIHETLSFDRVLVIDGGRIVEDGAPSDLRQQQSRYRELLLAETKLHQVLWRDSRWRRIEIANGRVRPSEIGGDFGG